MRTTFAITSSGTNQMQLLTLQNPIPITQKTRLCNYLLAADRLILVIFPGQCHQRWLNNATTKPQNKMQC